MAFDTVGAPNLRRLRDFVADFAGLVDAAGGDETRILVPGARRLRRLVATDDWLPADYAQAPTGRYCAHLLHCDSRERFCVVSFVWPPGQGTPPHDHTVWGLVGVLRGAELAQDYIHDAAGLRSHGPQRRLEAGAVEAVSPRIGDIHGVSNALSDRTSISIHVYGGNIGAISRRSFDADGQARPFTSGYANRGLPNLWTIQA